MEHILNKDQIKHLKKRGLWPGDDAFGGALPAAGPGSGNPREGWGDAIAAKGNNSGDGGTNGEKGAGCDTGIAGAVAAPEASRVGDSAGSDGGVGGPGGDGGRVEHGAGEEEEEEEEEDMSDLFVNNNRVAMMQLRIDHEDDDEDSDSDSDSD